MAEDAQAEPGSDETVREDTQRIGKFALLERLGKGSSGTVYKALDTFSGQEVALKVLDESLFAGEGMNSTRRQQFMNEASLAGRLQHPHIAGDPGGRRRRRTRATSRWSTCRAATCRAQCCPTGLLPVEEVLSRSPSSAAARSTTRTARASSTATSSRPTSWSRRAPTIKIADFGAALLAQHAADADRRTSARRATCRPSRCAASTLTRPERHVLARRGAVRAVHRPAAVHRPTRLTELLRNIVEQEPPPPSAWRPELDREVDRILMRMLRKEPEKRYPGWADLAFDLADDRPLQRLREGDLRPREIHRAARLPAARAAERRRDLGAGACQLLGRACPRRPPS